MKVYILYYDSNDEYEPHVTGPLGAYTDLRKPVIDARQHGGSCMDGIRVATVDTDIIPKDWYAHDNEADPWLSDIAAEISIKTEGPLIP